MTILQSDWAAGRRTIARPQSANAVHEARFTFDVNVAVATTDIIEIGALPAYAHVVDAFVVSEGAFSAATAAVGFMSGEFGSTDTARTSGTEFFAAVPLDGTVTRLATVGTLLAAPSETVRSIGVKLSAAATAAAGKRIHLVLLFAQ